MKKIGLVLLPSLALSLSTLAILTIASNNRASGEKVVLNLYSSEGDGKILQLFEKKIDGLPRGAFRIKDGDKVVFDGYRYALEYDDFNFSLDLFPNENSEPVHATFDESGLKVELLGTYTSQFYDVERALLENRTQCLELDASSVKRVYDENEGFDSNGLVVYKHLNGGDIVEMDPEDYDLLIPDTSTPGYKSVFVRYGDFLASYRITVKGFVYRNYDWRHVYYIGEAFDPESFVLFEYDETGEHLVSNYDVSFPNSAEVGLGELTITYKDFSYSQEVAIMERQDNVPLIFSGYTSSTLMLFAGDIQMSTYGSTPCTVSDGYYLLTREDGSLALFDFRYMVTLDNYGSYFGSSSSKVKQRLIPGGDLLVSIEGEQFRVEAEIWHHCVIGW